jgi:hypothetical protein
VLNFAEILEGHPSALPNLELLENKYSIEAGGVE